MTDDWTAEAEAKARELEIAIRGKKWSSEIQGHILAALTAAHAAGAEAMRAKCEKVAELEYRIPPHPDLKHVRTSARSDRRGLEGNVAP